MISVQVFLDNGTSYTTAVNGSCSDESIRQYFVGARFVRQDERTFDRCVNVRISR